MTKAQKVFYKFSQIKIISKATAIIKNTVKIVPGQILPEIMPVTTPKVIKFSPSHLVNKNVFNALSRAGKGIPKI